MTAEECRDVARRYFAIAVRCECDKARERAIVQGETWMGHWRYWTPATASLASPIFEEPEHNPVVPYRF